MLREEGMSLKLQQGKQKDKPGVLGKSEVLRLPGEGVEALPLETGQGCVRNSSDGADPALGMDQTS